MKNSGNAFSFEARYDNNGSIGLKESFNSYIKYGKYVVQIVSSLDSSGAILMPAYADVQQGFIPLKRCITSNEDLERYIKSNKPYFSKFGSFVYIFKANLVFDCNTGELLADDSTVTFYVPKSIGLKEKYPIILCDKLSTREGLNIVVVDKMLIQALTSSVTKVLNKSNTESRIEYTKFRIGGLDE